MQTIRASEFKAKCLALMDAAAATGETWVITKNGKPVAELRPFSGQRAETPFGLHPTLEIRGDVVTPLEDDLLEGAGVILDTHALLWMDRNDPALGQEARKGIEAAWRSGQVAVSAISFWEAAMLAERGRIALPMPVALWREDWMRAGLTEIPVDGRIALLATQLENLHRDPADRFIMATAIDRSATLITADRLILEWPGNLSRMPANV